MAFVQRSFAHQDLALVEHLLTSGDVGCCVAGQITR